MSCRTPPGTASPSTRPAPSASRQPPCERGEFTTYARDEVLREDDKPEEPPPGQESGSPRVAGHRNIRSRRLLVACARRRVQGPAPLLAGPSTRDDTACLRPADGRGRVRGGTVHPTGAPPYALPYSAGLPGGVRCASPIRPALGARSDETVRAPAPLAAWRRPRRSRRARHPSPCAGGPAPGRAAPRPRTADRARRRADDGPSPPVPQREARVAPAWRGAELRTVEHFVPSEDRVAPAESRPGSTLRQHQHRWRCRTARVVPLQGGADGERDHRPTDAQGHPRPPTGSGTHSRGRERSWCRTKHRSTCREQQGKATVPNAMNVHGVVVERCPPCPEARGMPETDPTSPPTDRRPP